MKILCATDFSGVSINAIDWVFAMAHEIGGAEIDIVHCVHTPKRTDIIISIDDMIMARAKEYMNELQVKFSNQDNDVHLETSVYKAYAKTFLTQYATQERKHLIVTGTTGLTSLKNIFVGSVTNYISEHTNIPLLTIAPNCSYTGLNHVVIGLGTEELKNTKNLDFLYQFLKFHNPKIYLVQVLKRDTDELSVDLLLEEHLKDLKYEYVTLQESHSVNFAINNFCREVKADLLCMIHHKRNWLEDFIHKSITKEELFTIDRPLLIVPD